MDAILEFEESEFLDNMYSQPIHEEMTAYGGKKIDQLSLDICDIDRYVKENELKEVTNPMFFVRKGVPSPDGLLSNEIFGITKDDREGTFAYIDLHGLFIDPSCYKQWCKLDKNIKSVVHRTETYIIDEHGQLVPDPKGKNGVKFLKDNIDKIKFKSTGSIQRDLRIKYIERNKKKMFITKYLVIPPYYRDVDTSQKGKTNIGSINKLYAKLLSNTIALTSTQDMGFDNTGAICGTIQETLVTIYDWFIGNNNSSIQEPGTGIAGKLGLLRMANQSKTSDYSSRLVISSANLKVEFTDDMEVNLDYSLIPLSATIANYKPYMIYHVKKFFENEFEGITKYPVVDNNGKELYLTPKDPQIEFSDERIETEMARYLHGYSNRFIPILIHVEENDHTYYMRFKGRSSMNNEPNVNDDIFNRRLTWCDVFYMAAVEACKDKVILITRYPIESQYSQIPTGIKVSSTKETEPVYFNNTYYPMYPKIRQSDIGKDTSGSFVDIAQMSNLLLDGLGADFDGDTISVKSPYTVEANDELKKYMNSKANFITLGAENIKSSSGDAIMAAYSLTKVLNDTKLIDPQF